MTATLATFASLLQRFYKGPITDQLNNEIFILKYFMKQRFGWQGESVILPVRLGRNTGVGTRGEGSALPVAGRQQTANLTVNSAFIYGRFEVTGPLMASAAKGGSHAFAAAMTDEMEGLTRDIKNLADRLAVSGGRIVGFINEKVAGVVTPGANAHGPAPLTAADIWQYYGDNTPFAATDATNRDRGGRIRLIRTDTMAEIVPGGANSGIMVCASDQNAANGPTLDIRTVSNTNGAQFTTVGVPLTVGIAVALHETQMIDNLGVPYGESTTAAGSPADATAATGWASEPIGMFGNVSDPTFFGLDRTLAANVLMRGLVIGHNVVAGAGGDGINDALELGRMQQVIDTLDLETGERPDLIVMNPLGRATYMTLLAGGGNAANLMVSTDKARHGDGGFSGISYAGLPIHTSRHYPQCTMAFLSTKSWVVAELQSGKFADEDGNILARVANADAFEGFWKQYYNLVCKRPRANAILIGFLPT